MIRRTFDILVCLVITVSAATGQTDTVPPVSPQLELVTVDMLTGFSELEWSLSPSPDVSGYVVYTFINDAGFAIDTIHSSIIKEYVHPSLITSEKSMSYVIAAFDNAGNISTLSNFINSIYATALLDSCNNRIEIRWNSYPSFPRQVTGYTVLYSLNSGVLTEAGTVSSETNSFIFGGFQFDSQYCFIVRANLQGGGSSSSNTRCISTRMQRPPRWINADFATVVPENGILVSFKVDPESEISSYLLERKTGGSGTFSQLYSFNRNSASFQYNDETADKSKINFYRLSAVNSCKKPVTVSNLASNIVPVLVSHDDEISVSWNPYREWNGGVSSYSLFVSTGNELEERYSSVPPDTGITIRYSDIMYEMTGFDVCFMIEAREGSNPYGEPARSRSSVVCTGVTETITVPNVFTPDNNLVNDLFYPVLSFTPREYHLLITDKNRRRVFESRDNTLTWDGTANGSPQPEGVYLWFLEVLAPSGKNISRTGTITIIRPGR